MCCNGVTYLSHELKADAAHEEGCRAEYGHSECSLRGIHVYVLTLNMLKQLSF